MPESASGAATGASVTLPPVWTAAGVKAFLWASLALQRRLPDRERGWLTSGSRSHHPEIVRSRQEMDYAPEATRVRLGLSSEQLEAIEVGARMLRLLHPKHQLIIVMRASGKPWRAVQEATGLSRRHAIRLEQQSYVWLAAEINQA